MPANPVEAGRKGGRSRSAAKLAAARRNGFQKQKPQSDTAPIERAPIPALIIATKKADV